MKLYVWFVFEENAINDIIVIIHTRSNLSTGMVRTGQSAEYYSWFVPHYQELLQDDKEQTLNTVTVKVWCIIRKSVISVISEIDISVIMCIIML